MNHHQRCWCEIDLSAIEHNLRTIRRRIGTKSAIICLVKANAYGHGIVPIAKFLSHADCQQIGCAHVAEGTLLRNAGIRLPILLLSGFLEEELPDILKFKLTLTLSSDEERAIVERAARNYKTQARVQVKIDTGMGRMGVFPPENARALIEAVKQSHFLKLTGTYTHYACADSDLGFTRAQWRRFVRTRGNGAPHHSCNSAALLALPEACEDAVRPGLAMYGISPIPKFQKFFKPALAWKSRVTFIKTVPKRTPLSYGATYITPRRMRVATVAVGYGDGLFRSLSNRGEVLIRGKRCRILGRVTMDQILVDVSRAPRARRGDEVMLIGKQGNEKILASDIAKKASGIPYEIWTHITERVPRHYFYKGKRSCVA